MQQKAQAPLRHKGKDQESTSTMKQEIKRICDQVVDHQVHHGKCEKHFETEEEDNRYMNKKEERKPAFLQCG